jgi:hypothetical protein
LVAVLGIASIGVPATAGAAPSGATLTLTGSGHHVHNGSDGESDVNVCADDVAPGFAHCLARFRTHGSRAHASLGNNGAYDPAYLESAYNAPSATKGIGETVAIVDAYDNPTAESDLAGYRSHFGLPACTTANGCFKKVNQSGETTNLPGANAGWALESALDLDMVSAMCPNCHIVLVEGKTNSSSNLLAAEATAISMADVVSNSWGSRESSDEASADSVFDHAHKAITFSSGDDGYGAEWPASSNKVVAVGGTTLDQTTNKGTRNATETVWNGAGSGCSKYESKPSWQHDSGCDFRTVADVSAVADPNTGVWVHFTYTGGEWGVVGGTSAASPIIAGMYALGGNPNTSPAYSLYANPGALNDITSGANGNCGSYLCKGVVGYDGPTGLGTPNGIAAFTGGGTAPPPPAGDFTITSSTTSKSVKHGRRASFRLTIARETGFTGAVSLAVSGIGPKDVATFNLNPIGATATQTNLNVKTASTDAVGTTLTLHVTATSGTLSHTLTLTIKIT